MKKIALALMLGFLAQAGFSQADKDTANLLKVGQDLPEFTLKTLEGKEVTSDDLYGKVVLITFFATWCPPCNQELPLVEKEIWAKYRNNDKFELLVIDREEPAPVIRAHIEKKKWTMPFYLDEKKEIYSKFATRFIPRSYLFDTESRLVLHSMGFKKEEFEVLKKEIEKLME